MYGTGTSLDGFFVAHSRPAAQTLHRMLTDDHRDCAAVYLSGHDEPPDDAPGIDMGPCK